MEEKDWINFPSQGPCLCRDIPLSCLLLWIKSHPFFRIWFNSPLLQEAFPNDLRALTSPFCKSPSPNCLLY